MISRTPLFTLTSLVCAALVACPDPAQTTRDTCDAEHPCNDNKVCVDGFCEDIGSSDAGTGGVISPACDYDTDCGVGEICDEGERSCADGLDCSVSQTICGFCESGEQNCGFGLAPAFCDANAGVCRRVHTSCQPCHSDNECSASSAIVLNHCVSYPDGSFCAVDCTSQSCPRGFTCDGQACILEEALGSCADAPACTAASEQGACPDGTYCTVRDFPDLEGVCLPTCLSDADCQRPTICRTEPGPGFGTCIDGCFPAGSAVSSQVCHENGRIGPRCDEDSDCLGITHSAGFECHDEGGPCQQSPCQGWCAQGGCDSSAECPLPRTYCEISSRQCLFGCAADDDCGAFEICDLASHSCQAQPCRGKNVSCDLEQWCCGKELYDGSAEPEHMPCPTDVPSGECFDMRDPYCRVCEDNADCEDIQKFGFPSYCYELKTEDDQGNEVALGKYCSVGCETDAHCPRGIQCVQELPGPEGETIKGCIDSRCVP